ncbi:MULTISPECIES: MFS transporter [Photorhabdus]|uniref:MFS transporter n=1 Tax=Photorhabdus TaxID=29487 RepID=UPI000DCCC98F|nr:MULTISPECIES: aromatic acid/H+ symport family MFS transporter [Photorhabdus]MCT8343370.1 aromatic acid/H+ symport family MFS transporter [Photorhabdus kleinii]RAW94860.1 aromatic acid/H+ symport family MFS transporter [Photorhabdus sp. S9-53]RAW94985.1 aromatic acid/H+ symport family MFS transporter [Photorhabdus sp. S10-54]RAW99147.1 aromatic acid/H+ symport family MFS transporter [Photorhabdus sp. S8-52]
MNSTKTVSIQHIINNQKFSKVQWQVLILCFLIVVIDGFDTVLMGYIAPAVVNDFKVEGAILGPTMSAALFGLSLGSIFSGPLADRFGRKSVLTISVTVFGLLSLATAVADSIQTLTILRFLTGLGLGAAMSNAITLISEYAPENRRSLLINIVFCGFPLGAAVGGIISAWIIPHFGWQGVLILGGILPLFLSLFLFSLLPESLRYLVLQGGSEDNNNIRRILSKMTGSALNDINKFTFDEEEIIHKSSIKTVLSNRFLVGTTMLWITYCMGALVFYVLTSWMPFLMNDVGFSISMAATLTALFPLGGVISTVFSGWLMDRINPHKVVATNYALAGILVFFIGQEENVLLLSILIFLAGITMNGAQASMGSISAQFYPTHCRATGVAWMLGFGRFGGIFGTLFGAELIRLELSYSTIFAILSIPAILAALSLTFKDVSYRRHK